MLRSPPDVNRKVLRIGMYAIEMYGENRFSSSIILTRKRCISSRSEPRDKCNGTYIHSSYRGGSRGGRGGGGGELQPPVLSPEPGK